MRLSPGDRVASYELVSWEGPGSSPSVMRYRARGRDREVVLHVVEPDAKQAAYVAFALDEASHLTRLTHPNLARVYELGCEGGRYFYTSEAIDGVALYKAFRRSEPAPVDAVIELGVASAAGLAHLHGRGIAHRDMTPTSIVVARDGTTKLDLAELVRLASPEHMAGKRVYLSPEHWQGRPLDARSDVFQLGQVLYRMVTGRLAFDGGDEWTIANQTLEGRVQRFPVPSPLEPTILRALARDPSDRYQNAGEFERDLRLLGRGSQAALAAFCFPSG